MQRIFLKSPIHVTTSNYGAGLSALFSAVEQIRMTAPSAPAPAPASTSKAKVKNPGVNLSRIVTTMQRHDAPTPPPASAALVSKKPQADLIGGRVQTFSSVAR